jgi:hypothetical protein
VPGCKRQQQHGDYDLHGDALERGSVPEKERTTGKLASVALAGEKIGFAFPNSVPDLEFSKSPVSTGKRERC